MSLLEDLPQHLLIKNPESLQWTPTYWLIHIHLPAAGTLTVQFRVKWKYMTVVLGLEGSNL